MRWLSPPLHMGGIKLRVLLSPWGVLSCMWSLLLRVLGASLG